MGLSSLTFQQHGGIFTRAVGDKEFGLRRDGDMASILLRSDDPKAVAFLGSNNIDEEPRDIAERFTFMPLIATSIRFALATKRGRRKEISGRVNQSDGLIIATSYPARANIVAEELGFGIKETVILGGAVEAAMDDDPRIDAIVEIVETGDSLTDSEMAIVADGLGEIAIGAMWLDA